MIGRTNSGVGGSTSNSAVIKVNAPIGSTITVLKGSVVIKALTADKGFVISSDNSRAIYFISVEQRVFGALTVQAEKDAKRITESITVDSVSVFEVFISYTLYLYNLGDENTDITGGLSAYPYKRSDAGSTAITPTVTKNASSIRITSGTAQNYQAFIFAPSNPVSFTPYSTMKVEVTENTQKSADNRPWLSGIFELENNYTEFGQKSIVGTGTISWDISNVTGTFYPAIAFGGTNNYKLTFTKWWLE